MQNYLTQYFPRKESWINNKIWYRVYICIKSVKLFQTRTKRNSIQDLMGTKSAASITTLRKSLRKDFEFDNSVRNHLWNHLNSGINLAKEKEKQDGVDIVNSYESFMKKHLSHFGYYSTSSKSSSEWVKAIVLNLISTISVSSCLSSFSRAALETSLARKTY